jgi:hypothetical protein
MPSTRKKPTSPKREYKTQRLELRLAPSKVIQQVMSVTGLAPAILLMKVHAAFSMSISAWCCQVRIATPSSRQSAGHPIHLQVL